MRLRRIGDPSYSDTLRYQKVMVNVAERSLQVPGPVSDQFLFSPKERAIERYKRRRQVEREWRGTLGVR